MAWRGFPALLILTATLLAAAPLAQSGPVCAALASPTRATQDDAHTGADAPDTRTSAVLLHPEPAGATVETYYWGWLDAALETPGADGDDWYAVELDGAPTTLMVGIVRSNYSVVADVDGYTEMWVELFAPGATVPQGAVHSHNGNVTVVDPVAGVWLIHAFTAYGGSECAPLVPAQGDPWRTTRNHGIYFGCDPICVAVE